MSSLNHTLTLQNICDIIFKSNENVIDSFVTLLKTKVTIKDIDSIVDLFKQDLHKSTHTFYNETISDNTDKKTKKKAVASKAKNTTDGEKKEKNPSIYNLFVSDHIKILEKNTGSMKRGEHMKEVSIMWNEYPEGRFFCKRASEIKKEEPSLTNTEVYEITKKEWIESCNKDGDEEESDVETEMPLPPTEDVKKPAKANKKPDEIKKSTKIDKKPAKAEEKSDEIKKSVKAGKKPAAKVDKKVSKADKNVKLTKNDVYSSDEDSEITKKETFEKMKSDDGKSDDGKVPESTEIEAQNEEEEEDEDPDQTVEDLEQTVEEDAWDFNEEE
jgi:hypothetical protein